ncbi:MAG: nucleotidyltransferase family protein [Pseudomonadota bacterium]
MEDQLVQSLNHRAVLHLFRATHGIAIPDAAVADIQSASAEQLVRISSSHGIAPMMADGLDQLDEGRLKIDRDLGIFFQEIREGNRLRNMKMFAQLAEAAGILLDNGIPVTVLKGGCVLAELSRQQFHRRFIGDLDLLVANADMSRAVLALEASGYDDALAVDTFSHSPDHHATPLVNRRHPAAIEIHRSIGGKDGERFLPAETIIGTAEETEITNLRVPSRFNRLVHAVFHSQIQDSGYRDRVIVLRNIADLVSLAADRDHVEEARRYFGQAGLKACFDSILSATDILLPDKLPPHTREKDAETWARAAIRRIGTPRKASFDIQTRKVSDWITDFATDRRQRAIYGSKLLKPGRVQRMLQTLGKFRRY